MNIIKCNLEEDKIVLQKKEWYGLNNISLHLGAEITHVDIAEQEITLDSVRKYSYDKLLIANGASNRTFNLKHCAVLPAAVLYQDRLLWLS